MQSALYAAFRSCFGCCLRASETDVPASPVQQVPDTCRSPVPQAISPAIQVLPDVKSPPERRCSIPLHRKRLTGSRSCSDGNEGDGGNDEEGRCGQSQTTASDIEEEMDDDDDDDDDDDKR